MLTFLLHTAGIYLGPIAIGALVLALLLKALGPTTPLDKFSAEQRKRKKDRKERG